MTEDRERFGWGFETANDPQRIESIASDLAKKMEPLVIGREYVYLDGLVLPANEPVVRARGIVGLHSFIISSPQWLARSRKDAVPLNSLKSPKYWDYARDLRERLAGGAP